jgi:hypothetical protein
MFDHKIYETKVSINTVGCLCDFRFDKSDYIFAT